MNKFGFYRIGCLTPRVVVNDPIANADEMLNTILGTELKDCDIVVTPELSIPSYSALKLFHDRELQQETARQVARMAKELPPTMMVGVGCHVPLPHATYNCTAVLNQNRIIGFPAKEFLPNCNEFEERQWFAPARDKQTPAFVSYGGFPQIPFGTRLMFKSSPAIKSQKSLKGSVRPNQEGIEAYIYWELCQAIWEPLPPSSFACLANANIVLNQSASPETVGKQEIRRVHVQSQSGRCMCVYAYCTSGPTESTSDVVMGGHNIIAECGSILEESRRVGDGEAPERDTYWIIQDVDVERCQAERRRETSFAEGRKFVEDMRFTEISAEFEWKEPDSFKRFVPAMPFVPKVGPKLDARCAEVTGIMECALHKRMEAIGASPENPPRLTIGLSGGLDSTMKACITDLVLKRMGIGPWCVNAWNMPGFGSTQEPKDDAAALIEGFGFTGATMDIRLLCLEQWKMYSQHRGYKPFGRIDLSEYTAATTWEQVELFHDAVRALVEEMAPNKPEDLIFENTQAAFRTKMLMDWGFVLGTGDMSELFQGWCTYGRGDHQSMYNANAGAPKTLIRFLIRYLAKKWFNDQPTLRDSLIEVSHRTISPELLPPASDGSIAQDTEQSIGPYELIDFLMWQVVRYGFSPEKIAFLGDYAEGWERESGYTRLERLQWMRLHYQRFLEWSQYKRDDVPNSTKIGSVCLSPRAGNWRMASDGSGRIWIERCDQLIASETA